jgi:hypothetical protein
MRRTAIALALCAQGAFSFAAEPIIFDPTGQGLGAGAGGIELGMFDWLPANALAVNGNPAGGLSVGSIIHLLSHAKLGVIVDSNGDLHAVPTGEITFVAGFGEAVNTFDPTATGSTVTFTYNNSGSNFFEIWWSPTADSNMLGGTLFNNTKRILYGVVTDSTGDYSGGSPIVTLDQFGPNNYPGIQTITGSGSTQLAGVIISADPAYFPGLTQAQIDTMKVFFNTSTVTPYRQTNPSAKFVDYGVAGGTVTMSATTVGSVNGGPHTGSDLHFVLQSDANQRFEPGEEVQGSCRVTYGGNDKNGNVDPVKFGNPECQSDPNFGTNCYTFGGQVGAPTADKTKGGPFGEHEHHQKSGAAGDFTFRAGTHSAPKNTRITDTACKDPGAIKPAEANAKFKQIDFEGTGSFSFPSNAAGAQAKSYLIAHGGPSDIASDNVSTKTYYFRVDMVDSGEPGNQANPSATAQCASFLAADQNNPLATPDPLLLDYVSTGADCQDVYQILICPTDQPCDTPMYAVRGFLTGGNIQMHKVIK